jgi:autophagy-related protein 18
MNHSCLIVALETKVHVFDLKDLRLLHVFDMAPNPKGVLTLSPSSARSSLLAFPASSVKGEVVVVDTTTHAVLHDIKAHTSPLACMAFNNDGSLLATASVKGTVYRIFRIDSRGAQVVQTLRRGMQSAEIYSLSFSLAGGFLTVCCDTGTIHVFKLDQAALGAAAQAGPPGRGSVDKGKAGAGSGAGGLLDGVMSLLPGGVVDMAASRAFAVARIDMTKVPNFAVVVNVQGQWFLHVATITGRFFKFALDAKDGGDCLQVQEILFLD